jgi:hypothetical protein
MNLGKISDLFATEGTSTANVVRCGRTDTASACCRDYGVHIGHVLERLVLLGCDESEVVRTLSL